MVLAQGIERWARDTIAQTIHVTFPDEFPPEAPIPLPLLQFLQAMMRGEAYYGRATKPAGWEATHNWGATQRKHPCLPQDLETIDHDSQGREISVCVKGYKLPGMTDEEADSAAIADVLHITHGAFDAYRSGNLIAAVRAHRRQYHFAASESAYGSMIVNNLRQIAAKLGEPISVLDPRPMNTDAIKAYIREVSANFDSTDAEVAKQHAAAVAGKREALPFKITEWGRLYNEWSAWSKEQLSAWVFLSDDVYDAARRYDLKEKAYREDLKPGGDHRPGDVPPTTSEQDKKKQEDADSGSVSSKVGTAVMVGGVAVAGAAVIYTVLQLKK